MPHEYFIFYLEMALHDESDFNVYAFINVSFIPTNKLIEIFEIDVETDPQLLQGYFLTNEQFVLHKEFLEKSIGPFNLDVFQYTLQQYIVRDEEGIRKMYKQDLME